jgi:hypothetical protein
LGSWKPQEVVGALECTSWQQGGATAPPTTAVAVETFRSKPSDFPRCPWFELFDQNRIGNSLNELTTGGS